MLKGHISDRFEHAAFGNYIFNYGTHDSNITELPLSRIFLAPFHLVDRLAYIMVSLATTRTIREGQVRNQTRFLIMLASVLY